MPTAHSTIPLEQLQEGLLHWFAENQRPLPWRKHYRAYEVWISEIMLQQTQVKTALPYYERWMKALPDIASVAHASEDQLLKLWEGLGYYSRVKNIHKTAKVICENHSEAFPESFDVILTFSGIGRYTAGAIMSIAFNQEYPILDGNVTRIICRIMDLREPPQSTEMQKKMWTFAEEWIPENNARFFNQAMMELGATICTPQAPSCLLCPVNTLCKALQNGSIAFVPAPKIKKKIQTLETCAALVLYKDKILIQKRNTKGLLEGLWEFPGTEIENGSTAELTLKNLLKKEYGLEVQIQKEFSRITHRYTSFKANLQGLLCIASTCSESFPIASESVCEDGAEYFAQNKRTKAQGGKASSNRWVSLQELADYAFSAPHAKLIQRLKQINFLKYTDLS